MISLWFARVELNLMTVIKNCMFWRLTSYLFSLIPKIWNLVPFQLIFLFKMGSCRFKCIKLYRDLRHFYRNKSQTQICSSKENAAFFKATWCVWLLQIDLCGGPEFYHKRSIDKHNRNCPTRSTNFDQMITLILSVMTGRGCEIMSHLFFPGGRRFARTTSRLPSSSWDINSLTIRRGKSWY